MSEMDDIAAACAVEVAGFATVEKSCFGGLPSVLVRSKNSPLELLIIEEAVLLVLAGSLRVEIERSGTAVEQLLAVVTQVAHFGVSTFRRGPFATITATGPSSGVRDLVKNRKLISHQDGWIPPSAQQSARADVFSSVELFPRRN